MKKIYNLVKNGSKLNGKGLREFLGKPLINVCYDYYGNRVVPIEANLGILNFEENNSLFINGISLRRIYPSSSKGSLRVHRIMGEPYQVNKINSRVDIPRIRSEIYLFDSDEEGLRFIEGVLDNLYSVDIN